MLFEKITQNRTRSLFIATSLLLTSPSLFAQEPCTTPTAPTITGDLSICEGGNAELNATTDADEVRWYSAASQGTLLHTGFNLTLENLEENTSVWAETVNLDTEGVNYTGGARLNPGTYTGGAAVSPASKPWGLRFNLMEDIVLNSVDVFIKSESPGIMVIQLKDRTYQVLEELIVSTPAGNNNEPVKHTIDLGFNIPAGIEYSLVSTSSPTLVREGVNYHAGFPYLLGDVGVITQGMLQDTPGAANAATYYFFYNWDFTVFEDCVSDRVSADITVNEFPGMPIGQEEQTFIAGETLNDLEVEGLNLTWYADSNGDQELEGTTELIDGTTYYVSQSNEDCESEFLPITVSLVLGVNELNLNKISVWPVPATDVLFISGADSIDSIEIFNTLGQSVKRLNSEDINENIYVGDLSKGMYIIQMKTASNVVSKQIIIQ